MKRKKKGDRKTWRKKKEKKVEKGRQITVFNS